MSPSSIGSLTVNFFSPPLHSLWGTNFVRVYTGQKLNGNIEEKTNIATKMQFAKYNLNSAKEHNPPTVFLRNTLANATK
jgi:hypothetical protein